MQPTTPRPGRGLAAAFVATFLPGCQVWGSSREQAIDRMRRALGEFVISGDLRTNLDLISSHYAVVTSTEEHRAAVRDFIAKRGAKT